MKQKKSFDGMSYREIQRANSIARSKLTLEDQNRLKVDGLRNVTWEGVIRLYQAIQVLSEKSRLETLTLSELLLEADNIREASQSTQNNEGFNPESITELVELNRWAIVNLAIKKRLESYSMSEFR